MKKIGLILAGCLAFVGVYDAHADDLGDAVRAAYRRDTNTVSVSTRQRTNTQGGTTTTRGSSTKDSTIVNRGSVNTRNNSVVSRSAEQITPTPTTVVARTTSAPRTTTTSTATKTRSTKPAQTRSTTRKTRNVSRATTNTVATREAILGRSYSTCKQVFNDCMDEFCANKDSQLKRCACSARIHDFDKIKKQLANVDEKMLDFNQRLLTVSMDEKDVAVINTATEGEEAFYNTKDVSQSKRTLDEIAKKLNTSFDKNTFSSSIGNVLTWSLDMDSAFDNIDSLGGVETAAKSGTALYSAALPICREMAAEVCSDYDLSIAESGYQILVDKDCDTVQKTYKSAAEQARTKVLESSALLDMSRLNVYQKKNADDILTCKRKMLAMLTDSTVCGENLGKCLDVTGQYIDPSTGEAFLSPDLANLSELITRPEDNQYWARAPGNAVFVSFLDSKKKFLESAMENCQDIADTVWTTFVEEALSQIKIAQLRKLEEVRQSCTTLTAQCLTNANDSVTNFDARALSTFGVAADLTVNAMCDKVLSSCTTLLNITDTKQDWFSGMTGIQNDITYDTIKRTCREVGRACIIQVCTSTSGNFGLCENIDTSVNRKSIINRTACWDDVLSCVRDAGTDKINAIFEQNKFADLADGATEYPYTLYYNIYDPSESDTRTTDFTISNDGDLAALCTTSQDNFSQQYPDDPVPYCVYDICYDECGASAYVDNDECRVCRLAESIWGNCEANPVTRLANEGMHNRIKTPRNGFTTLLHWFAQNTNTENVDDNCRDTTCGVGFIPFIDQNTQTVMCIDSSNTDSCDQYCPTSNKITVLSDITNCCGDDTKDAHGNCCNGVLTNDYVCVPSGTVTRVATFTITLSDETQENQYYAPGNYTLYCAGTIDQTATDGVRCNGRYFVVEKYTGTSRTILNYMDPEYNVASAQQNVCESFKTEGTCDSPYTHKYDSETGWGWYSGSNNFDREPQKWTVSFGGCGN